MKRILHIIHGLSIGGAETFIYNLMVGMDKSQFVFDFAIQNPNIKHLNIKHLTEMGGKILLIPAFTKAPIAQYRALKRILATGYDCVHIHMNAFVNPIPAIVASKFPNKVIIHSHNSLNSSGGEIAKLVHKVNKTFFLRKKFARLACSDLAGRWMFGNKPYSVVNNAVDLSRFKFNEQTRQELRHQLGINDEFVIGHVGRFVEQKNHKLLLKIFAHYRLEYPADNAQLVLVGDGPLFEPVKALAEELKIADSVCFIGSTDSPEKYYNVFDCFLFPSLFEGLAFVAIEAQANGLPIIASDNVTREINISNSVQFIELSESLDFWCKSMNGTRLVQRSQIASKLINSKFDLHTMVEQMSIIYQTN